MSGPGVSESKTATGCDNPHVEFVSTVYQPDSQYCVNGTHTDNGDTASSSDCTTSPAAPPKITSVAFERIQTDDLPIDVNPNTGGGLRLFPDDKIPNDPVDRRKIRVRAKLSAANGGVPIYFRSYDLDDPFTDALPIDPNNNSGNDNNGNVDGTPDTRAGQFTVLNGTGCDVSPLGFSCPTNSAGEAVAEFTTTMQPGDNFAVAASADSGYLSNVTIDGTNLKDAANAQIPVTTAADNFCQNSTIKACRAEMLTVWRRLHIEVDSMGDVTGNKIGATIPVGKKYAKSGNLILDIRADDALEENRFENGGVLINGYTYPIVGNSVSSPPVPPATKYTATVTIKNRFGNPQLNLPNDQIITLYDDDDFNDDDIDANGVRNPDGDIGEDVREPDISLLTVGSDDPNTNIFANAYTRPVRLQGISDSRDNSVFQLNTVSTDASDIRPLFADWDSSSTNVSAKFWSIYLLGAYQHILSRDNDPEIELATYGIVDEITGVTGDGEGSGALIYVELHRPSEILGYDPAPTNVSSMAVTVAHEVGHLFSCEHGDGDLMGDTPAGRPVSNKLSPKMLNKIRRISHP